MIATVKHIHSLNLPELEPYRTLKRPLEHLQKGIFVAEGEKVVFRLLNSAIRVFSLLLTEKWFEQFKTLLEQHIDLLEIYIGEKQLLDTIVGHELHQAIMAIGKVPLKVTVDELIKQIELKKQYSCVLLDGIVNAENMGVIIRNCACFGIDAVIVLPNSCDPYLRRSVRNSMGNIFQLPIIYIQKAVDELKKLKQCGVRFYAAHPASTSKDIREITFTEKRCIVFGAEGNGISHEVLDLCDEFAAIPMKEGVDSLNVASASAVMMWEIQTK